LESIKWTEETAKEIIVGATVIFIKGNLKMIFVRDKVKWFGAVDKFILDSGKMDYKTVKDKLEKND
jgi:hypothetical protein